MSLIVQKYGGSSVATPARIRAVAQRVKVRWQAGDRLVVVVSAMGDTTDDLLALGKLLNSEARGREVDLLVSTGEIVSCSLLALALQAVGVPARALTGAQAGIVTDGNFSRATIADLKPDRLWATLGAGEIPIVAGFQGISGDGRRTNDAEITTLGRGGSDTTAVALAVGLKADRCEIYTDVDGIFTADPRAVPRARQLTRISPVEMLELAQQGAQVMHPRAVELGGLYSMPILVASSFRDRPGTWIIPPDMPMPGMRNVEFGMRNDTRADSIPHSAFHIPHSNGEEQMELRNKVSGVAHDTNVARLTVFGLPKPAFALHRLFGPLAEAGINVDAIAHSIEPGGEHADCTFTVAEADLARALTITEQTASMLGATAVEGDKTLGKVSIIGLGVQHVPGLAAQTFAALESAGIKIEMVTTSQVRITCLVPEDRLVEAARLLHSAFGLDSELDEEDGPVEETEEKVPVGAHRHQRAETDGVACL
jgi:aspartate kinase